MSRLLRTVHDIWCAITHRCRITMPANDPDLQWLRDQEVAARQAAGGLRQRRTGNPLDDAMMGRHY